MSNTFYKIQWECHRCQEIYFPENFSKWLHIPVQLFFLHIVVSDFPIVWGFSVCLKSGWSKTQVTGQVR